MPERPRMQSMPKNKSTYKYFSSASFAAAEAYIERGMLKTRQEYAELAAINPDWELEVVCWFIDFHLHPALTIDFDRSPPKLPDLC